ncbi:hypothetical protein M153_16300010477 [Pseudoloma neurophilia]|uniref:Uncharacterized protein n=1 Tax=Pseudoloma neurophilia TaxID=146866 RepID=A0A0R0LZM8_9MICR|nr:hypothetical protein M153_16300010477 [Pseudoloma neurophilia]
MAGRNHSKRPSKISSKNHDESSESERENTQNMPRDNLGETTEERLGLDLSDPEVESAFKDYIRHQFYESGVPGHREVSELTPETYDPNFDLYERLKGKFQPKGSEKGVISREEFDAELENPFKLTKEETMGMSQEFDPVDFDYGPFSDFHPDEYSIFFTKLSYVSNLEKLADLAEKTIEMAKFDQLGPNSLRTSHVTLQEQAISIMLGIPGKIEKMGKKKRKANQLFDDSVYRAIEKLTTKIKGKAPSSSSELEFMALCINSVCGLPTNIFADTMRTLNLQTSTLPIFLILDKDQTPIFLAESLSKTVVSEKAGDVGSVHFVPNIEKFIDRLADESD